MHADYLWAAAFAFKINNDHDRCKTPFQSVICNTFGGNSSQLSLWTSFLFEKNSSCRGLLDQKQISYTHCMSEIPPPQFLIIFCSCVGQYETFTFLSCQYFMVDLKTYSSLVCFLAERASLQSTSVSSLTVGHQILGYVDIQLNLSPPTSIFNGKDCHTIPKHNRATFITSLPPSVSCAIVAKAIMVLSVQGSLL